MSVDAAAAGDTAPPAGLSSAEAARRLARSGPNTIPEARENPVRRIARHFWAPVPWMLEATIALELVTGQWVEAILVAALLVVNAAMGLIQEGRASATLALLRERLEPVARARRDGAWADVPAARLVPGDVVELALGAVVPADARVLSGSVSLDQSTLTGESIAVDRAPGGLAYAGALVTRGDAVAEVTATGTETYFGRTAELVEAAGAESTEQRAVLGVVRVLTIVNVAIVAAIVAYAVFLGLSPGQIVPLVLAAMLSAVPVAMPAVFTMTAAVGARRLADKGVLLTRLSSLQEAATIDVLCVDKTGTLTENDLAVTAVVPAADGIGTAEVLGDAAAASSPGGKDPVDAAVRAAAAGQAAPLPPVIRFTPFDPATKMAEALVRARDGTARRVVKGSPLAVAALAPLPPAVRRELDALGSAGARVLAVAAGDEGSMSVRGLIALADPPRPDSAPLLARLDALGVDTVMVTGDTAQTARAVARAIGLDGALCPPGRMPESVRPHDYDVFAGVLPEDKFALVRAFQRAGHGVGMCGDGANDAPALRQAQVGIAVANATDVAKSAAGLVLTTPGLAGILACIEEGRAAFQRAMTFTMSMLVNKAVTLIVLGAGLVLTGHAVMTPLLQAIWMLTGDLPMMARAADRATPTPYPNAWRIRELVIVSLPLGALKLCYVTAVLVFGWIGLGLPVDAMQTLTFLTLVLAGHATGLTLRTRDHVWRSRPSGVLLAAIAAAYAFAIVLVVAGWFMTALPWWLVASVFATTLVYALCLDVVKVALRRWRPVDRRPVDRRPG